MTAVELPALIDAERSAPSDLGRDLEANVVWLRGEHDLSTSAGDSEVLATAIAYSDADVLVDLSEVQFMDASTIRTLMRAHAFLGGRSRSLTLRHPSPSAGLAIRASGLEETIHVSR